MLKGPLARSIALLALLCAACGSNEAPVAPGPAGGATSSSPTKPVASTPPGTPVAPNATGLVGRWTVSGSDARGPYEGQAEIRNDKAGMSFTRTVRYTAEKVEDGRDLHWLFQGSVKGAPNATTFTLASSLKRMDFIWRRGGMTRTAADVPIALAGTLAIQGSDLVVEITGPSVAINETWRSRTDLPATPLYEDKRTVVPSHDPLPASEKQLAFGLYGSFHSLEVVKPYVSRPEFQAAQHGHVVDRSDLEFYRANPSALRVVGKVIDVISLGETRARADAFRHTLAKKAELYDKDLEERFIDPDVGMVAEGAAPGTSYPNLPSSGDSSLWTGIYVAGQVYRHQVTGSAVALANVVRSLNALLTLQEITNDWSQFARTLRKTTGAPPPGWHAGTGPHAALEWQAGGNNDMIKGLFYGYLMGWELLCEGGKTGHEALCARIRTNAKHLADDVQLGGSNAPASQLTNKLPAAWLAAVVADDVGDKLSYHSTTTGYWAVAKAVLPSTSMSGVHGLVEGSGAHLESVSNLVAVNLAKRMNLGDADVAYREHIDRSYKTVERHRLPEWDLLKASFGSAAGPSSPAIPLAISRLEEAMYPKLSYDVDRTLSGDYCMSPFPSHPWKNDWMGYPSTDRTMALTSFPLFEGPQDLLYWKVGNRYRASEPYEPPGPDFVHLYWFARKHGLISATE